ncbi:hypothetical protein GGQ84_001521 [Desulfitispora alkaliphila]
MANGDIQVSGINLSNQANLTRAKKLQLYQFNFVALLGLNYLSNYSVEEDSIPISIKVKKTGEVELSGIDEETLNNQDNVRVYADKKVTDSEANEEGDEEIES